MRETKDHEIIHAYHTFQLSIHGFDPIPEGMIRAKCNPSLMVDLDHVEAGGNDHLINCKECLRERLNS